MAQVLKSTCMWKPYKTWNSFNGELLSFSLKANSAGKWPGKTPSILPLKAQLALKIMQWFVWQHEKALFTLTLLLGIFKDSKTLRTTTGTLNKIAHMARCSTLNIYIKPPKLNSSNLCWSQHKLPKFCKCLKKNVSSSASKHRIITLKYGARLAGLL